MLHSHAPAWLCNTHLRPAGGGWATQDRTIRFVCSGQRLVFTPLIAPPLHHFPLVQMPFLPLGPTDKKCHLAPSYGVSAVAEKPAGSRPRSSYREKR